MPTTVINIRDAPSDWKRYSEYVYIGRFHQSKKYGVIYASKWGNPFKGVDAVERYEYWLERNPDLMRCLPELKDKVLVCWCKPKPCHGDVLSSMVNKK